MNKKLLWFINADAQRLLTNLISFWTFDSNANDSKGVNNGSLTGSPTNQAGLINNGYLFAASKYITITANGTLVFGNSTTDTPFSLSFWINATSFSGAAAPIWKRNAAATSGQYSVTIAADGKISFSLLSQGAATSYFIAASVQSVSTGSWVHVVATYNGSSQFSGLNIYINGVKCTVTNGSAGSYVAMGGAEQNLYIGGALTSFNVKGMMDEVGIWGRELRQSDINYLYNSGAGLSYPSFK